MAACLDGPLVCAAGLGEEGGDAARHPACKRGMECHHLLIGSKTR